MRPIPHRRQRPAARRTARWLVWGLLLSLAAAPSGAAAQGNPFGTIAVLKDRQAGSLEDVRRLSREVSVVRAGAEEPAAPGMALYPGDAIRTSEGTCVVGTADGGRIEIGERSQVRLQPTLLQRLGEIHYLPAGALELQVGEAQLSAVGGGFKLTSGLDGSGTLVVVEGSVRVAGPGGEQVVDAPAVVQLVGGGLGAVGPLPPEEAAAITSWRAERFEPGRVAGLRRDRVHVRLEGGLSRLDEFSWGRVGLTVRARPVGPLWIDVGASVAVRPTDELIGYETAIALPVHAGARLIADLPGAAFLGGGADFTLLVGDHCVDAPTCRRELTAEPGVRLSLLGGLLIGRRVGVDLEIGGGVVRRRFPSLLPGGEPIAVPDPQVRVAVGVFVRL